MEEEQLAEDEQYVLDGKGLREKLLDVVSDQEEYVRKVRNLRFLAFKLILDDAMSLRSKFECRSRTTNGGIQ